MKPPRHDPNTERTVAPFPNRLQRLRTRLEVFNLRDYWWKSLDVFESSRAARISLYLTACAVVIGGMLWFWAYPWWNKRNAVKMAREWLAAGRYKNAVEAVQQAMIVAPENPEPWQIAAELARLGGQKEKAVEYAHHAANLAPEDSELLIAWAAAALRADMTDEASRALDRVTADERAKSSAAQRVLGELARRQFRFTAAEGHFEAAARLDGRVAIDEVPLGLILLNAKDPAVRQRGTNLLIKWTADRDWSVVTMRALLADAQTRDDRAAMLKWAEALRLNPGCTVSDMPTCLQALSKADEKRFAEVLSALERDHATSPDAAVQLLSWLNQIGRSAEAVKWMQSLPEAGMRRPPLVVEGAEALRLTADWPALQAWTKEGNWGPDAEFLRWAYGLQAARMLGNEALAEDLLRTLRSHAQLNGVHALFAGSTLYGWGRLSEAETLWWIAAAQEGKIAVDALGTLARHYQVQRDAEGLYRVFRQLHLLRPQDAGVGNNFAFYAALTGREQRLAEQVARANLALEPHNPVYLATYAFNLFMQNRTDESLALLKPRAAEAAGSPPLSFAYGLALAGTKHESEARRILAAIPSNSLTLREAELIKSTLAD